MVRLASPTAHCQLVETLLWPYAAPVDDGGVVLFKVPQAVPPDTM